MVFSIRTPFNYVTAAKTCLLIFSKIISCNSLAWLKIANRLTKQAKAGCQSGHVGQGGGRLLEVRLQATPGQQAQAEAKIRVQQAPRHDAARDVVEPGKIGRAHV